MKDRKRVCAMGEKTYDVIIVGGGVMGSSVAYHLMLFDNSLKIAVIEKDPIYKKPIPSSIDLK